MSNHTPGPWRAERPQTLWRVKSGEFFIAENVGMEADARLMAAAPDLLAAAKVVRDWYDQLIREWRAVPVMAGIADLHAAIAKAEGVAP